MIFLNLLNNIALLVALSVIHSMIMRRWKKSTVVSKVISGMLFGAVAVVGMATPLRLLPGIIFDGRSIVISIAGFFGGPIAGAVAAVIAASYRISLGGAGTVMGASVITESACIGVAYYYLRRRRPRFVAPWHLLAFGVLVHLVMLLLTVTLPGGVTRDVLHRIAVPVITIYPMATLLMCMLFLDQERRLKAEERLRQTSELLNSIINASPISILTLDPEGRVLSWNPAAERMFGWTAAEAIGRPLPIVSPEKQAEHAALRARVLSGEAFSDVEVRRLRRDGSPIDISISTAPLRDETGRITGIMAVNSDVTERKRAEAERERLVKELEAKNQELESLLYAASHDMRSPLLNIQGFAEELEAACTTITDGLAVPETCALLQTQAPALNERIRTALQFIRSSGEKMNALIAGMLRTSRTGRAALRLETLDMNALLDQVVSALSYQIQQASAHLEIDALPPCRGDADQMNQVFTNLLDNALKYKDPSRPLHVRVTGVRQEDHVIYCVEDNGGGIPPEHQPHVWELFHRLDPRGVTAGEGVGLTLVQRIVERHNGRVWLESEAGKGSRFFVAVPTGG